MINRHVMVVRSLIRIQPPVLGPVLLPETGLYYNYFRDYDPQTGRYLESDPVGLAAGVNTYAYALANPISFEDPLGTNVTMTCRPLSLVAKLGASIPRHCGVVVWHWSQDCPPKKIIDRQFSLAGYTQRPTLDPTNQTYLDDRNSFMNPGASNLNFNISPPGSMTSTDFDAAVINSGNNYSLPGSYSLRGPNSNTAATSIITGAGGVAPVVPYAPAQFWKP
jgi:RHS repeat-associated protein